MKYTTHGQQTTGSTSNKSGAAPSTTRIPPTVTFQPENPHNMHPNTQTRSATTCVREPSDPASARTACTSTCRSHRYHIDTQRGTGRTWPRARGDGAPTPGRTAGHGRSWVARHPCSRSSTHAASCYGYDGQSGVQTTTSTTQRQYGNDDDTARLQY